MNMKLREEAYARLLRRKAAMPSSRFIDDRDEIMWPLSGAGEVDLFLKGERKGAADSDANRKFKDITTSWAGS